MPVTPSQKLVRSFVVKLPRVSVLASLLGLAAGASTTWAQAPPVVIDAQQVIGTGYLNPQAVATNGLADKGAVFVADTNNDRVVAIVNKATFFFQPQGFTLVKPQALAEDAAGNLYIGDSPSPGVGRVIKMTADNARNLTGAATQVAGAPLTNPISMVVDSTGTLYIGDFSYASNQGAIYSLAPGAAAPTLLSIAGVPSDFFPGGLLLNGASTLFFSDNGGNTSIYGGVYTVPVTGGTAQPLLTPGFTLHYPSGLASGPGGDLYILTLLATAAGDTSQVLVVPAASPATPYVVPMTGGKDGSSLTIDFAGNLDVVDSPTGTVTQLTYTAPTDMGHANVGQPGAQVTFNVEFNQPGTLGSFRVVSQGDVSTDLSPVSGGTCTFGQHTTGDGGALISPATPYNCVQTYQATPQDPGVRLSSILVRGSGITLASAPVYQTAFAGEETIYPLRAATTVTSLQQPQSVAISGLNKKVYVADTQAGLVYSINGLGGKTLTPVSTGAFVLQQPIALALDGAGNLFIADAALGEVIEVPTATGEAPSMVIPPGGVVQHPIALAVDNLGNLYVGDAGPAGAAASSADPGYVVKVPVGGAPFKMVIPSIAIVYPQALAIDYYTNNLYIGDGGDLSGVGQVFGVAADDTGAGPIAIAGVTNPTGLGIAPAGDLYVLDGTSNTITVHPLSVYPGAKGVVDYVLPVSKNLLQAASSLAVSAGGQSLVVANTGGTTTNNLVFLNGNRSTLAFGNVVKGTQSQPQTATVYNIGNLGLTLGNPYESSTTTNTAFSLLGSSICGNNLGLLVGESCTINVEFTPNAIGPTSEQVTVNSTAFNTAVPTLTLQGTGTTGGAFRRRK